MIEYCMNVLFLHVRIHLLNLKELDFYLHPALLLLTVYSIKNLRWFGHVKRRDENSMLSGVMELEVEGSRPVGRP